MLFLYKVSQFINKSGCQIFKTWFTWNFPLEILRYLIYFCKAKTWKNKFVALHFILQNLRWTFASPNLSLNIFKGKCTPRCIFAKMHFCTVLLNILHRKMYANKNSGIKMHFCINAFFYQNILTERFQHFPLEIDAEYFTKCLILCWIFSKGKCSALTKCDAKLFFAMHQMHFCTLNIFLWKIWCWTFSFGKCDAEHFTS